MSITADSAAVDGKVSAASHFLNFPSMATEAFTKNLTSLSSGVIVKTGTWSWARLTDGSKVETNRHKAANRMEFLLNKKDNTSPPQCFHPMLATAIVRSDRDDC